MLGKFFYKRVLAGTFADKVRCEAQLKSSGLDWTLAYPVTLTDKPASNNVSATPLQDTPKLTGRPRISRSDVAAFLTMNFPDLEAMMGAMQTPEATDGMEHGGVIPGTLVIQVESQ